MRTIVLNAAALAAAPADPGSAENISLREYLRPIQADLSDAIHSCVVEALEFPASKPAHRFYRPEAQDFDFPVSASERYTIIEISVFEGRSIETKKHLTRLLSGFRRLPGDRPLLETV